MHDGVVIVSTNVSSRIGGVFVEVVSHGWINVFRYDTNELVSIYARLFMP